MESKVYPPLVAVLARQLARLAVALLALGGASCQPSSAPSNISRADEASQALSANRDEPARATPRPPRSPAIPAEVGALIDRLDQGLSSSADGLFVQGRILSLYGQTDEALWCWQESLVLDPTHALAQEQIGVTALRRGEYESGVAQLRAVCELDPQLVHAKLNLGKALIKLGRHDEAIPVLENQAAQRPETAETWFRLGQAYMEREELEQAQKCFAAALRLDDRTAYHWFGMWQVHERLKDSEKAQQYRQRFLELEQEFISRERNRRQETSSEEIDRQRLAEAYSFAAELYAREQLPLEADGCWRRMIELDPPNVYARRHLFRSLAQQDRPTEALAFVEQLRRLEPGNVEHLLSQSDLQQQLKRVDAAEECLLQAIEIAPDNPTALTSLVRLYLATGQNLAAAQRLAERLVRLQPTAEHYFIFSSACFANNDRTAGRAALEHARRLDPDNPTYAAAARILSHE